MNGTESRKKYGDIIDLPYFPNPRRRHISRIDRAAQFAPFAALTGYDDMVREEGRLTEQAADLSEYEIEQLDRILRQLDEQLRAGTVPTVTVTYFLPDEKKSGGSYRTLKAPVKGIDPVIGQLFLYGSENIEDKRIPQIEIPLGHIIMIEKSDTPV